MENKSINTVNYDQEQNLINGLIKQNRQINNELFRRSSSNDKNKISKISQTHSKDLDRSNTKKMPVLTSTPAKYVKSIPTNRDSTFEILEQFNQNNVSYEVLEFYDTEVNTEVKTVQDTGPVETEYKDCVNITDVCETVDEQILLSNGNQISILGTHVKKTRDDIDDFQSHDSVNCKNYKNLSLDVSAARKYQNEAFSTRSYLEVKTTPSPTSGNVTSSIEIISNSPVSKDNNNISSTLHFRPRYNSFLSVPGKFSQSGHRVRSNTTNMKDYAQKRKKSHPKRSASCSDVKDIIDEYLEDYVIVELTNEKIEWRETNHSGVYINVNSPTKFTNHLL